MCACIMQAAISSLDDYGEVQQPAEQLALRMVRAHCNNTLAMHGFVGRTLHFQRCLAALLIVAMQRVVLPIHHSQNSESRVPSRTACIAHGACMLQQRASQALLCCHAPALSARHAHSAHCCALLTVCAHTKQMLYCAVGAYAKQLLVRRKGRVHAGAPAPQQDAHRPHHFAPAHCTVAAICRLCRPELCPCAALRSRSVCQQPARSN